MARIEADREDLFHEAKALSPAWELLIDSQPTPIVLGLRRDGRLSIYLHHDLCFHFNDRGQLLRAYCEDGCLYRTQGTTLARLRRERSPEATVLRRTDLEAAELETFVERYRSAVASLQVLLRHGAYRVLRSKPDHAPSPTTLLDHLTLVQTATPSLAPPFPTRKR